MSASAALALAKKYRSGGAVETHPPMRIKKHINFQGLQISIETPKGEIRRGVDREGKPWANRMADDYGYIKRTEGKDGDQVDVFVGPNKKSDKVFIIDQLHHHMEKFDEHKCLLGYNDRKQALTAYHKSYGRVYGAHHTVGGVTEMSVDAFKEWLKGGGGKKPVSPDVPKYQEGGAVSVNLFDPAPMNPPKTPRQRVMEGHQEFEQGYLHGWDIPDGPDYPMTIMNMRGQQLHARRAQEGGAVKYTEPTPEDPTRYPYYESEPGPGTAPPQPVTPQEQAPVPLMDVTGVGPVPTFIPEAAKAIGTAAAEYVETPGELMKGPEQVRPRVKGQWDEIDEFRQRLAHAEWSKKATDFAAETGLNLFGTSAPFAKPGMLGVAGGKLFKEGQPKKYEFKGDPFKEKAEPAAIEKLPSAKEFDLDPAEVAQWDQVSGSKGTSPGGIFADLNGEHHYIKQAPSLDYAKNEVLTGKLYELAGVPAAKPQLTMLQGKPAVASRVIEGSQLSEFHPKDYMDIDHLREHFPADAWLANWDAIGAGFENPRGNIIINPNMDARRIDFGGGLRYSGLGAEKGAKFGKTVDELNTMRDPGINPSAASVFGDMEINPNNLTAQRITRITDEQIRSLVNKYGPESTTERERLADTLIARRDDLAEKYGLDKGEIPSPPAQAFPEISIPPTPILKPMNINKTHEAYQIVGAMKDYDASAISPKIITPKQQNKIKMILGGKLAEDIAQSIADMKLSQEQTNNITSWLPKKTANEVSKILKNPKGLSQYELDVLEYEAKQQAHELNQMNIASGGEFTGQKAKHLYGKEPKGLGVYKDVIDVKPKEWWKTYQPQLGKKRFDPYQFSGSLRDRIQSYGFRPDLIFGHGTHHEGDIAGYPKQLKDPALFKSDEPGYFTALDPEVPAAYGWNIQKYVARPKNIGEVDWEYARFAAEGEPGQVGYNSYTMHKLIEAARNKGLDLLIVNGIYDIAKYGGKSQTQYVFLNPTVLRAPTAKFDPAYLHLARPLAGVVGGGLFSYGMLRGQESEEQKFARGGAVTGGKKITRDAFLYMEPKPPKDQFAQCGTCAMFTGTGCTILGKTHITKDMTCALYVHGNPSYDLKGKEMALVSPEEAGLYNGKVRCENCRYGGAHCKLYRMLNDRMPETFDLETQINSKGCCNAFIKKG